MAYIEIEGTEYQAKTNFKFERVANEKYSDENTDGFTSIYTGLLQYSNEAILQFWDCALAHLKKDKPSTSQIEEALEERMESEDVEELFREAFQTLDKSGFYKKKASMLRGEMLKELTPRENESDAERREREQAGTMMKEHYEDLSS